MSARITTPPLSAANAALAPSQTSATTFVSPPPITTFSPTPMPSSSGDNNNNTSSSSNNNNSTPSLGSSASLYLYTFLATLVLLLGVSSAIVLRSIVIRRRQRRLMEEAIRNGTWVPFTPPKKIDPNDRPILYQVYAALDENGQARGIGGTGGEGDAGAVGGGKGECWDGFHPFFGAYTNPLTSPTLSTAADSAPGPTSPSSPRSGWRSRLPSVPRFSGILSRSLGTRHPDQPSPDAHQPPPVPLVDLSPPGANQTPSLRYAVLIAMPSVPRSNPVPADESGELPHLEFGVAEGEVREADRVSGAVDEGGGERKDGGV